MTGCEWSVQVTHTHGKQQLFPKGFVSSSGLFDFIPCATVQFFSFCFLMMGLFVMIGLGLVLVPQILPREVGTLRVLRTLIT